MKTKDIKELHDKNEAELRKQLAELQENYFRMKLEQAQYKLKNTRQLFLTRKDIARVQTMLHMRKEQA